MVDLERNSVDRSRRKNSEYEIQDHPDNSTEPAEEVEHLKYPKSVFFIVSNEFCERFSYYGMRTVLTLYLRNQLSYSDDTSTVIYHVFTMFVYFFPLFGAMLADSWLGKYRTIFYVSIIYAIGQILLSCSAAQVIGLPEREFSILGLLLIALGTGGIKPCVAAFGGDQFILPQQERYISTFFSLFYFAINSGSLISSFLTPLLRSSVTCFGQNSCYSLAFFVPAVLMIVSIVIFAIGKPMYRIVKPTGNVVLHVTQCVSHAIANKIKNKKQEREHWLDYADDHYDRKLIDDIKAALQVLKLFIPLPIFWALFDQQGSRWTIQATRMNGELGSYLILPDQMQVVNPLLILIFIPLFETCIYPLCAKIKFIDTPLKKLTVGSFLAAVSFVVSALVEMELEKSYPVLPSNGVGQLRVFNTLNCPVTLSVEGEPVNLDGFGMWQNLAIETPEEMKLLKYEVNLAKCKAEGFTTLDKSFGDFKVHPAVARSYAITGKGVSNGYKDVVQKPKTGDPAVRALIYADTGAFREPPMLHFVKKSERVLSIPLNVTAFQETELKEISPGVYDILVNDEPLKREAQLKLGGVYAITGSMVDKAKVKASAELVTVTQPNTMHILWLIPQYILLTMGEVMFSVTGLEFAFTQAPVTMKSLLQASWLLTVAFGNLIVVIVAEVSLFKSQVYEFVLFAALMFIDIIIFAVMAKFYKYVVPPAEEPFEDFALEGKNGNVNPSYRDDEK